MSKAPERIVLHRGGWRPLIPGHSDLPYDETLYVRADVHEAERALNAELVAVLRDVHEYDADRDDWNAMATRMPDLHQRMNAALARAEAREKGEG